MQKTSTQQRRKRYLAHFEEERAQQSVYRQQHREEIKAQQATYRKLHGDALRLRRRKVWPIQRERYKTKRKAWEIKNKEHLRDYYRQWYVVHKEQLYLYVAAWRKANPEKAKAYAVRSEHRRRDAKGHCGPSYDQWLAIKAAYAYRCVYCGRYMKRLTQDHVIPLSKGGTNTIENIVPACKSCNCRKHANPAPLMPAKRLML